MKYEVNFGGFDFKDGITIEELYVGNDTNKINSNNKPVFKTLNELATICYIYGITVIEPPTPEKKNLFIFNSTSDLVDNVSGSNKFMVVTYKSVKYNITPDGNYPVESEQGVASVEVTDPGDNYTSPPAVAASEGDAEFVAKLKAVGAEVTAGGSGYAVGDTITLSNGVVLKVATLSDDAVATVNIDNAGSLTGNMASNPVAQDSTSGSGTGGTFSLTYGVESVSVTDPGSYEDDAPDLSFSGGAGSGAAATASLESASKEYTNSILVKENTAISDAEYMQFVLDGNVVFSGKKADEIEDVDDVVDWLTGNYDQFGDYENVSSGLIKAISLTGSQNHDSANFVRFR